MAIPESTDVRDYIRRQGILAQSSEPQITLLNRGYDSSLFEISGGNESVILKWFAPDYTSSARREAEGLRVCGAVGLAPQLTAFDDVGATLHGPVVIYQRPQGISLRDRALTDEHVQAWTFLLLTLHHLAPEKVHQQSTLSTSIEQWWERIQPLWNDVRAAYAEPMYAPLLTALEKLRGFVDVHVRTNRDLWVNIPQRPCHGDPLPANLFDQNDHLILADWSGFGLGDIALELGRSAALAALNEEITSEQYIRLVNDYLDGTRDLKDASLEQRLQVFASVFPFGFTLFMLSFLARLQAEGPESTLVEDPAEYRGRGLMAVARGLVWIQDALGIEVAEPNEILSPFGAISIAHM